MTVFRATVSHPGFPLLTIERLSLTDLMVCYGGLAREGWRLVGDPVCVEFPDYQEAAA